MYNFIVVYVSELQLDMFDKEDCRLTMRGDPNVPEICRRGIFGLYQPLSQNAPPWVKKYYDKFRHFRETIHGVVFIKNSKKGNRCYIDLNLEYYFIGNNNLIGKEEFGDLLVKMEPFLKEWTKL